MKATHTPGPWHYVTGVDGAVVYTGVTIATIPIDALDWLSNAHLIASAPDLLAALNRLIQSLPEDSNEYPDSASARQVFDSIRFAREAISKATGGAA